MTKNVLLFYINESIHGTRSHKCDIMQGGTQFISDQHIKKRSIIAILLKSSDYILLAKLVRLLRFHLNVLLWENGRVSIYFGECCECIT